MSKEMPKKSSFSRAEFGICYIILMALTYGISSIALMLVFIPFSREFLYLIVYGLMSLITYHRVKSTPRTYVTWIPMGAFVIDAFLPFLIVVPTFLMVIGLALGLGARPSEKHVSDI